MLPWFKTCWLLQGSHTLTSGNSSTSPPPHAPEFPSPVRAEWLYAYLQPACAPQTMYSHAHFPQGPLHLPTACLMHTSGVGFFKKKRHPVLVFVQKAAPQREGIMPVLSCHCSGVRALPQDVWELGSVPFSTCENLNPHVPAPRMKNALSASVDWIWPFSI